MHVPPLVVCPYDAELYGHWWYEGPYWLYILFKKIYYDECNFKLITPGDYIDMFPEIQVASPCISSWGRNGYSEVWLNGENDYAHKHLHVAGDRMVELAHLFPNEKDELKRKALNQVLFLLLVFYVLVLLSFFLDHYIFFLTYHEIENYLILSIFSV